LQIFTPVEPFDKIISAICRSNHMKTQNETCPTCPDGNGKGYLYAAITAILCPCHLPLVGLFLGGGAAGAFFAQHFMLLAITLGVLSLISFITAVRILL
jgi:hypothetical protein